MSRPTEFKLDSSILLLLLLYSSGSTGFVNEPIRGRTRLQKLFFLAYEEGGLKQLNLDVRYVPHKAGPFSPSLIDDLELLRGLGLAEYSGYLDEDDELQTFKLTRRGVEVAERVKEKVDRKILQTLQRIKKQYNNMPLKELLRYVYAKYPEYTIYSKISL